MSTKNNVIIKDGTAIESALLFERGEEMPPERRLRSWMMQIFPSVFASLICLPFGIMLGWPSPTYPKLLALTSPIPISMDQTAMVAGFLMIGNIFGTLISDGSFFGTKYGIILGLCGMLVGWILMWFAADIYYLLSSRIIIGLSFGYAAGQLKIYIKELCEPQLAQVLSKCINFYALFGVVIAYILGYFLSFTTFSLAVMILTAVLIAISLFLPHSAREYLRFGKTKEAETMIKYLKSDAKIDFEMQKLNLDLMLKADNFSIFQMLRKEKLRKPFAVVVLLTFFQQFTGAPATVVYAQMTLRATQLPYAELCAIGYIVLFFISNLIGVFYCSKFNRKYCLLFSNIAVSATLVLNVCTIYYDFNRTYWKYTSLVSLCLYIFFHSIGLAVVPTMLIPDYFPARARNVVSKVQIMCFSAFAIIITKIFQVLYHNYSLYVAFLLFSCISIVSAFFIVAFVPYKPFVYVESNNNIKNEKEAISL
uniref:Major facilitator superfamily (MFS) profile domain-containing protein n=2 Tax=Photinus pyralis TaxID=7054 RepID=A0A1Y1K906_PHOPY